jgi:hypothetical protein
MAYGTNLMSKGTIYQFPLRIANFFQHSRHALKRVEKFWSHQDSNHRPLDQPNSMLTSSLPFYNIFIASMLKNMS